MACIGIEAWKNNLDYDIATMSSRALHSSDLIKHQPSNKSQRLCGASPIQEQFHPQCYLDAPQHTYGELTFAFIKKDERPSKTGPRAFKAIYAGKCRKVKDNILVHPIAYDIKTGSWTILPSQSVCQYRIIAGCMPLLTTEDAIIKDYSGQTEDLSILTYEEVLKKFPALDSIDEDSESEADPDPKPVKAGDWEIEKIIEHKEIAEDDYDYCVRWKGWSPEWDTWHSQENLEGCQKIIEDYWKRLTEGHIAACLHPQESMPTQAEGYNMSMAMFMGKMGATEDPARFRSTTLHQGQIETLTLNEHQIMALVGVSMTTDNMIASAVEYKVLDFM